MKSVQDINSVNEIINLIETEIGEDYAKKSHEIIHTLFTSVLSKIIDLTSENEQFKKQSIQNLNNFFY